VARVTPKEPCELSLLHLLHLIHVNQTQLGPSLRGSGTHAGQGGKRKSRQESGFPSGPHLHQSSRLGVVGRDLGDHPVRPDAHAGVEAGALLHRVPELLCHGQKGDRVLAFGAHKIEIGFVQGGHHYAGGEILQHRAHGPRSIAVVGEGALEESGLGAAPHRFSNRHSGVDAEPAGGVGRGLHHPALIPASAHHQQLDVPELGVVLAADLDEEGIQIDVQQAGGHRATPEERRWP
jgi:hypothetical protein